MAYHLDCNCFIDKRRHVTPRRKASYPAWLAHLVAKKRISAVSRSVSAAQLAWLKMRRNKPAYGSSQASYRGAAALLLFCIRTHGGNIANGVWPQAAMARSVASWRLGGRSHSQARIASSPLISGGTASRSAAIHLKRRRSVTRLGGNHRGAASACTPWRAAIKIIGVGGWLSRI